MRQGAQRPNGADSCGRGRSRAHSRSTCEGSRRRVFATVSPDKRHIAERFGATAIDYRSLTPEQYVALHTGGEGFDVIYDTVGGPTIDASFVAVKRYTGHVISCLGWSTHSLAPLSFRSATYSGVFTLYPAAHRHGPGTPRSDTP